jgi:cellulose synthase/poly-beta-1,6-N-acetylglucosamine synthase-like glycosyltransferase
LPPLNLAWTVLLSLGAGAAIFAVISLADGLSFSRRMREALQVKPGFQPKVAVLIPVRGEDPGFERTLDALLSQDYPAYRLLFIVDSDDPAARRFDGMDPSKVTVLTSGPLQGCSGKIAALLTGLEHVQEEVVVFADSDILPDREWLSHLVAPLTDSEIAASTGYRWYFQTRPGLGPALQSAWNSASGNILFNPRWTYLWGGSYAVRLEVLKEVGIEDRWRRSLSDDMVLTQALKARGHRIAFAPRATVANETRMGLREVIEWTNRQACLALLYAPAMRRLTIPYGIYAASLVLATLSLSLILVAQSFLLPTILLLSPLYLGLLKSHLRRAAFRRAMPSFRERFSRYRLWFYLASAILPFLMLYNVRKASRMTEFEWRGKVYRFTSPEDITVVQE